MDFRWISGGGRLILGGGKCISGGGRWISGGGRLISGGGRLISGGGKNYVDILRGFAFYKILSDYQYRLSKICSHVKIPVLKQNLNNTQSYLCDEKNKRPDFPVVILKWYKQQCSTMLPKEFI